MKAEIHIWSRQAEPSESNGGLSECKIFGYFKFSGNQEANHGIPVTLFNGNSTVTRTSIYGIIVEKASLSSL